MKVLGVMLSKTNETELSGKFNNEISFIHSFSDVFEEIKVNKPDVVILEGDELNYEKLIEIIERIMNQNKKIILFVIGERSNMKIVAGSIKAGAYDYLLNPVNPEFLFNKIEKARKDLKLKAEKIDYNKHEEDEIILGNTGEMVEIYKIIGKVADASVPILIIGENGTGKEMIARSIHGLSERAEMSFVTINCNTVQGDLLDKKIYGYDKHGIDSPFGFKQGSEEVNKGTLFLKEVSALTLDMQAKLLSVLQLNDFSRIGGRDIIDTDIRIIASTSKNLEELINEGKFIEELYHKLKVVEIDVPALRERKDDIPILVDSFIKRFSEDSFKNIKGISKPALSKIMKYEWPGNIRELRNTIKSSMALCRGNNILVEDLPAAVIGAKISKRQGDIQDWVLADWVEGEIELLKNSNQKNYYGNIISRVERELIRQVLEFTNGKKVETAEILGITRNTLRTKMNSYGLE